MLFVDGPNRHNKPKLVDGRPFPKSKHCHISAMVWPIVSKSDVSSQNFEFLKLQDGGQSLFYKFKNHHFTTVVQGIAKKFGMALKSTLNPVASSEFNNLLTGA